jgi:hypothetical protein
VFAKDVNSLIWKMERIQVDRGRAGTTASRDRLRTRGHSLNSVPHVSKLRFGNSCLATLNAACFAFRLSRNNTIGVFLWFRVTEGQRIDRRLSARWVVVFVPEGQHDRSQARSAWKSVLERTVRWYPGFYVFSVGHLPGKFTNLRQ